MSTFHDEFESLRSNFTLEHPEITFKLHSYRYSANIYGWEREKTIILPFKGPDINLYNEWLDYIMANTPNNYYSKNINTSDDWQRDPYYRLYVAETNFKEGNKEKEKEEKKKLEIEKLEKKWRKKEEKLNKLWREKEECREKEKQRKEKEVPLYTKTITMKCLCLHNPRKQMNDCIYCSYENRLKKEIEKEEKQHCREFIAPKVTFNIPKVKQD